MALDIPQAILDDRDMQIFAERLKEALRADGRSESEIARQLGWQQKRFNNYVRGERGIRVEHVPELCRVLGTHPNYLFGWSNQLRPKQPDEAQPTAALEGEIRRLQRMLSNFRRG